MISSADNQEKEVEILKSIIGVQENLGLIVQLVSNQVDKVSCLIGNDEKIVDIINALIEMITVLREKQEKTNKKLEKLERKFK